jgi:hypothetical protein
MASDEFFEHELRPKKNSSRPFQKSGGRSGRCRTVFSCNHGVVASFFVWIKRALHSTDRFRAQFEPSTLSPRLL